MFIRRIRKGRGRPSIDVRVTYLCREADLTGKIEDVQRPESVWIGAIKVRLRAPYILVESREDALEFMRALAMNRDVECSLTGERAEGVLVGNCMIWEPDGREIDLGVRQTAK